MNNIQNNTHFIEFIKTISYVVARKYKKLEKGMLWEKDFYLQPSSYELEAKKILNNTYEN